MPVESGPRILDSHTVTRQAELRDEMQGREFVHASRLELLKRVTERLHEDTIQFERHEWSLGDEYLSSRDQDEESNLIWSDDNEDDHPSDESEGDEYELSDETAYTESVAGLVGDLVRSSKTSFVKSMY
jgi:hypothetical protein